MGIETGDTISDLNPAWPLGSDPVSQGDNHIRLVKDVIVSDVVGISEGGTFEGAVTFESATNVLANLSVSKVGKAESAYVNIKADDDQDAFLRIGDETETMRGMVGRLANGNYAVGNSNLTGVQQLRGPWVYSEGVAGNSLELSKAGSPSSPALLFTANGRTGIDNNSSGFLRLSVNDLEALVVSEPGGTSTVASAWSVSGRIDCTGGLTAAGALISNSNITSNRLGQGSPAYMNVQSDPGFNASIRFMDDGGSNAGMVGKTSSGQFFVGNTSVGEIDLRGPMVTGDVFTIGTDSAQSLFWERPGITWSCGVNSAGEQLRFQLNGSDAARLEAAGTQMSNNQTIATREKGDNRWVQSFAMQELVDTLVAKSTLTQGEADAIMALTAVGP